ASSATPWLAVVLVSVVIAGLVLLGDVKTTWSFSAFTVLVYYALTNLAALRLSDEERLYPRVVPWGGLNAGLFLGCWVDMQVWMTGRGLIGVGLLWRRAARRLFQAGSQAPSHRPTRIQRPPQRSTAGATVTTTWLGPWEIRPGP